MEREDSNLIHGEFEIRDGKSFFLRNITEGNSSITNKDPLTVLNEMYREGWRIDGDCTIKLVKEAEPKQQPIMQVIS